MSLTDTQKAFAVNGEGKVANEFKIERAAVRYRIKSARFNDWRWYVS